MKTFSRKRLAMFFQFLDDLRESGVTNMYGAPPYLMDTFDLDRDAAVKVTSSWMKSFSREKSPTDRAQETLLAPAGA